MGSIQQNLDVAEIKDGVVVLTDGSLRSVLAVSSVNFDLKSNTEQEATIFAYQRFLNALDFPLHILITTRKFDIKPYLNMLKQRKERERSQLLRNQIDDYMIFVRELVDVSSIMSKLFYVTVPFYAVENRNEGFFSKITGSFNKKRTLYQKREQFETQKNQLFQRVDEIRDALSSTGVRAVPLNTQELIEMFYNYYNPSAFEHVVVPELKELNLE